MGCWRVLSPKLGRGKMVAASELLIDTGATAVKNGDLDAVVFHSPILVYYVLTDGAAFGQLAAPTFQYESDGTALPSDSKWIEPINQSILKIHEDSTYAEIYLKWFDENP